MYTVCIENNDTDNGTLQVVYSDGSRRMLQIKKVLQNERIPFGMRESLRCMWEAGDFGRAYVLGGDIVWPGRCEVLSSEIEDYFEIV